MSSHTEPTLNITHNDWSVLSMSQIQENYAKMADKLESRRVICRKSSKNYYNKTFKLSDEPSMEEIQKNTKRIEKRDNYQKKYYNENKDLIKQKQRDYRAKLKERKKQQVVNEV